MLHRTPDLDGISTSLLKCVSGPRSSFRISVTIITQINVLVIQTCIQEFPGSYLGPEDRMYRLSFRGHIFAQQAR